MDVVVIKTGSAVLVDRSGALDVASLSRVCDDIGELRKQGRYVIWVASGAVARGAAVHPDRVAGRELKVSDQQALSAIGQGVLYREISDELARRDLLSGQVLLTSADLANRRRFRHIQRSIGALLRWGCVPVVNENDSVTIEGITFGNNDMLAAQVAALLGASVLVLVTSVPGVYRVWPSADPADFVPEIDDVDEFLALTPSLRANRRSALGRGGMAAKLRAAQLGASSGVDVVIGSLDKASVSELSEARAPATRVRGRREHIGDRAAFRFWLRHAGDAEGGVAVDAGAQRVLSGRTDIRGASLLAVGVTGATGDFEPGDPIDILGPDGEVIARGIARLSRDEVDEASKAATSTVVVHRNDMIVF